MRNRWLVGAALVALFGTGCSGVEGLTLPASVDVAVPSVVIEEPDPSTGMIRVAYPDEPAAFVDVDGSDPAAIDLAALWGIPLFRVDANGQRQAALAASVGTQHRLDGTWAVSVVLHPGQWTDGTPVTSADVAATVDVLRAEVPELAALRAVETPSAETVVLVWDRETAGWWQAVDAAGSILPASVLTEGGLAAYAAALPVTGGPFSLADRDVGRSLTFEAHAASPVGAPASAGIELLVSNSFETSLGLLERREVDAVLGHLALNPVPRAAALDGVRAAAPLGGTTVALEFRPDGPLGAPGDAALRRGVIQPITLGPLVEGLLGDGGARATSPWPAGPSTTVDPEHADPSGREVVTVLPRGHEVIGFTARAIQRDVEGAGVDMQFVSFEAPAFQTEADLQGGAALRVRRDPPRPLLGPRSSAGSEQEPILQSFASFSGPGVLPGLQLATDAAMVVPLYRVGVVHAWREGLQGFEASSWPGLGFVTAGEWTP